MYNYIVPQGDCSNQGPRDQTGGTVGIAVTAVAVATVTLR